MKLDATPETVAAVAQVLKLAGYLDDRVGQPDKGRIMAWAEQVHRHQFTEDDLLAGLQAFYDGPHDHAIGVGDLIAHAKVARRTRVDSESRAEREALQAELDAIKPEPGETRALMAGFIPGPVPNRTDRLDAARDGLHTCVDRKTSMAAIREYFAAKKDAQKPQNANPAATTPTTTR